MQNEMSKHQESSRKLQFQHQKVSCLYKTNLKKVWYVRISEYSRKQFQTDESSEKVRKFTEYNRTGVTCLKFTNWKIMRETAKIENILRKLMQMM